jgi:cellulose synthase/poly-beta-1,6-N-acetylglucosamine synthase-like glycosyltransferase
MFPYIPILATLLILPFFAYLALITAAALRGRRRGGESESASAPVRFVFVVPAHDEEENIGSTIASCRAVSYEPALARVCVIADNCSDGTARAARAAGAEVIERYDPVRRSKGYALEYFFEHCPPSAGDYDAAVLIDADTIVDPGILTAFAAALAEGQDWIQCYYTVRNPDASWRTRLMTYAFSLFNGVWLLGQDRLGLGIGLKGNGMCFSSRALVNFPWRAHGLAEDLEFSWMLRVAGERIHFLPGTRVYASMPIRGGTAAVVQRRRWESGRKALRGSFLGPLLRSRRIGPLAKAMYVIDLIFPPLMTLVLGLLIAASLHLWAEFDPDWLATSRWLLPVHSLLAVVLACYALSPFLALELPIGYATSLVALPYFAVWKLLVSAGRNPPAWVRTPREPAASDARG